MQSCFIKSCRDSVKVKISMIYYNNEESVAGEAESPAIFMSGRRGGVSGKSLSPLKRWEKQSVRL